MPRFFNGGPSGTTAVEYVQCSLGNAAFQYDALTYACIYRRNGNDLDISQTLLSVGDSSDANVVRFFNSASGVPDTALRYGGQSSTLTLLQADGWALVAVTVPAGASQRGTFYKGVLATNSFTTDSPAGNVTKPGGAQTTSILHGATSTTLASSIPFQGDIAIQAIWDSAMTSQQVQSLMYGLESWFQIQPRGLWLFDQDAITQKVIDMSGGGANESGRLVTSVSTGVSAAFSYAIADVVLPPKKYTAADPTQIIDAITSTATSTQSLSVEATSDTDTSSPSSSQNFALDATADTDTSSNTGSHTIFEPQETVTHTGSGSHSTSGEATAESTTLEASNEPSIVDSIHSSGAYVFLTTERWTASYTQPAPPKQVTLLAEYADSTLLQTQYTVQDVEE
jgi:hypothetical protein